MRFKEFLVEHVRHRDGEVAFSEPPKAKEAASRDFINTQPDNKLHPTESEASNGETVYSSYLYKSSDVNTDLLSSLKGQGPHKVDPQKLDDFLERTVSHAAPRLKDRLNPTAIIFPKSSSTFTEKLAAKLAQRLSIKALPDVFVKRTFDLSGDKATDRAAVEKAFIRTEHPKYSTLKPASQKALVDAVLSKLKSAGQLSSKGLPKDLTKFIKNFVKLGDQDQAVRAMGERILLVDDVLSSGMTMRELMSLIRTHLEPEKLAGYTVFKLTTGKD